MTTSSTSRSEQRFEHSRIVCYDQSRVAGAHCSVPSRNHPNSPHRVSCTQQSTALTACTRMRDPFWPSTTCGIRWIHVLPFSPRAVRAKGLQTRVACLLLTMLRCSSTRLRSPGWEHHAQVLRVRYIMARCCGAAGRVPAQLVRDAGPAGELVRRAGVAVPAAHAPGQLRGGGPRGQHDEGAPGVLWGH